MAFTHKVYIHPTAVIDSGVTIGQSKIWHFCHVMSGAIIGDDCILGHNVFVGPGAVIGDRVKIQNNVSIFQGAIIEDGAFIGPHVCFTNVFNPRSFIERKDEFRQTTVKCGATIGANSTILCGITLGEYCMVGAGSVVTHDVTPYSLVYGNPARPHGWVSMCGESLHFVDGAAFCGRCKGAYSLTGKTIIRTQQ